MNLPLLVLLTVFVAIALRKIGRRPVAIWQAMVAGAAVVLLTGRISPLHALHAIDWDVMAFLFGMFIIGHALVASGYLYALSYRLFGHSRSSDVLVLTLLLGGAVASAVLMNDTLAIIGTPLVLRLAREHRLHPKLLLLTLCFAVTLGSVASPIGNPQNLLIALWEPMPAPFHTFARHLLLPTLINLLLTYLLLRLLFRRSFHATPLVHRPVAATDPALARLTRYAMGLLLALLAIKTLAPLFGLPLQLRLSHIALIAALPIMLFSPRRIAIVRGIDWRTLAFFAAMFVLMASVWDSGVLQHHLPRATDMLRSPGFLLGSSILLSQLISNVPLVALYLPLLHTSDTAALMLLAAGSTIAGNLLLLGAASNVIVVQSAERHGTTLGFLDFARAGIPVTLVNACVYGLFLMH